MGTTEEAKVGAHVEGEASAAEEADVAGEASTTEEPKAVFTAEQQAEIEKLLEKAARRFQSDKDKSFAAIQRDLLEIKSRPADDGWRQQAEALEERIAEMQDMISANSPDAPHISRKEMLLRERQARQQAAKPATPEQPNADQLYEIRRLQELSEESGFEDESKEIVYARYLYSKQGYKAAAAYLKGLHGGEKTVEKAQTDEKPQPKPKFPVPSVGNSKAMGDAEFIQAYADGRSDDHARMRKLQAQMNRG